MSEVGKLRTMLVSVQLYEGYVVSRFKNSNLVSIDFTEIMRVLGYPRHISIGNFHLPNFPLVAEILVWLVKRFDPDADISGEYKNEEDRISVIRTVAEFMALKTNVKLNTKRLYQAEGYAVRELLKVATLLCEAQSNNNPNNVMSNDNYNSRNFDISDKKNDLQTTRQLASQVTVIAATLFDLLGHETDLREIRNSKIARQFDTSQIEIAFNDVINDTRKEINETKNQIENVKETEQNLDYRIERKRTELDRNQKRLQTLKKVRPAFMEEFEKLETELRLLYDNYIQKFRYLAYLEHLYDDVAKAEQERFERRQESTRKQLEKMRAEDANFESIMEGNDSILPTMLQESSPALTETEKQNTDKIIATNQLKTVGGPSSRMQMSQRRVYGSMSGRQRGTIQESNDSGESLDSDSDLLIDGDLEDDEDEDVLNSVMRAGKEDFELTVGHENRALNKMDHSDEDF